MNEREERKIHKIYRGFLRQEIKRPEIGEAKRELIKAYFPVSRPFFLKPAFSVSALSLAGIVLLAVLFGRPLFDKLEVRMTQPSVKPADSLEAPAVPFVIPVTLPPRIHPLAEIPVVPAALPVHPTLVDVRWATSRVGSTMVYQKQFQDVPVTIIWVFPGESSL
ncbi:MAG TPA: hypothetical protein VD913_06150 [bacterium]|nr:hypothetical protein [bacterium]